MPSSARACAARLLGLARQQRVEALVRRADQVVARRAGRDRDRAGSRGRPRRRRAAARVDRLGTRARELVDRDAAPTEQPSPTRPNGPSGVGPEPRGELRVVAERRVRVEREVVRDAARRRRRTAPRGDRAAARRRRAARCARTARGARAPSPRRARRRARTARASTRRRTRASSPPPRRPPVGPAVRTPATLDLEQLVRVRHDLVPGGHGAILERSIVARRRPQYPSRARGVAQPGSALRSGRRGPQFESGHPDLPQGNPQRILPRDPSQRGHSWRRPLSRPQLPAPEGRWRRRHGVELRFAVSSIDAAGCPARRRLHALPARARARARGVPAGRGAARARARPGPLRDGAARGDRRPAATPRARARRGDLGRVHRGHRARHGRHRRRRRARARSRSCASGSGTRTSSSTTTPCRRSPSSARARPRARADLERPARPRGVRRASRARRRRLHRLEAPRLRQATPLDLRGRARRRSTSRRRGGDGRRLATRTTSRAPVRSGCARSCSIARALHMPGRSRDPRPPRAPRRCPPCSAPGR